MKLYTKSLLLSMFKEIGYVLHRIIFDWKNDRFIRKTKISKNEKNIQQSLNIAFERKRKELF